MTDLATITEAAAEDGLSVVGAFHPATEDLPPEGCATLILLGPGGPQMWQAFQSGPEATDGGSHPMDRWSRRVIGALAEALDARAFFPFGGPPYAPFQRWAARGEHALPSPVAMQVSPVRGLWASYRGALAFKEKLALPERPAANPCIDCASPCLTACPVGAFADGVYDVPRCVAHLKSGKAVPCLSGCLVRRACPAGADLDLPEAQRAFHIDAFLAANG